MKEGSDNWRQSAIQGIMKRLMSEGVEIIIYEPSFSDEAFLGSVVLRDIVEFKRKADIIIANRSSEELGDVHANVLTRDIFGKD